VVYFFQVFPSKPYLYIPSPQYMPHAVPIWSFLIWLPKHFMQFRSHEAVHYVILSIIFLLAPFRSQRLFSTLLQNTFGVWCSFHVRHHFPCQYQVYNKIQINFLICMFLASKQGKQKIKDWLVARHSLHSSWSSFLHACIFDLLLLFWNTLTFIFWSD
jgi:hypothetical protein